MKPGRIVAIVIAALIAIPALGMVFGGTALGIATAVARDDDGYFDATLERLSTATAAITTGEADLRAEPGPPAWFLDFLDVTVRVEVDGTEGDIFIGIGPEAEVDAYLDGVARDEVVRVDRSRVQYRTVPGDATAQPPDDQSFWVASASGSSPQELTWDVTDGSWVAVLMNVDGSPGLLADVTVGIRSGAMVPIAISLVAVGVILLAIAVVVIVLAATAGRRHDAVETPGAVEPQLEHVGGPVTLEARIDDPSQWLWLVKWFLAIPHFVVLALLWLVFLILTVIAWFAILFTGRYPRAMFDFNVGVLRWTWRVLYYFGPGGLGTDRYPPFTTEDVPDYPARLDIAYPERLSRGLVLVKSWLLAIPHYLVLAVLLGWGTRSWYPDSWSYQSSTGIGLIGVLVFIAAVILLFTGKYPKPLFDFIIGLNRWVFRVEAYVLLMTDEYPPFRLDQGGEERTPAER